MDKAGSTDGRIARGIRTRLAIVSAHTELVREGELRPTAQMVADRAGVSVRTIWTNFSDAEALLRATTDLWMEMDLQIGEPVDPDLPLAERIDRFCTRQAERVEHLAPAARSSALGAPFSPALRDGRRTVSERLRSDLERTFSAELGPYGEDSPVYDELYVTASWPVWQLLTEDLGRSHEQALRSTIAWFRQILRA